MSQDSRDAIIADRRFVTLFAIGAGIAAAIPALAAFMATPLTGRYIGSQWATDDQMVYAAWMRQAMDGHLLMDNRFTTAVQPGLTIHLYFFVLGLIAKLFGIVFVSNAARVGLSVGFIFLLHRVVLRLDATFYARKLAMALAVFGGGLGFFVWHLFGETISRPAPPILGSFLLNRLPTDVWQPEGFVFPSMLVNGLFMASLCLIVVVFLSVLSAQKSTNRIVMGVAAMAILMNIHSYDVLLVGLTLVGLMTMQGVRRALTSKWILRVLLICAGAVPPALWFLHVLSNDPVFQARAATETFTPNFRQVLFGYFPMIVLAFVALAARPSANLVECKKRLAGSALAAAILLGMTIAAKDHAEGYFMGPAVWSGLFLASLGALALLADENPTWNLVASWALLGTVGIYFPGLFQRKLAMGLSIPWAILAAMAIAHLVRERERHSRNLATILVVLVFSATSVLWAFREVFFVRTNVSRTTVQPVYLNHDVVQVLDYLNQLPEHKVVVAPAGRWNPGIDPETNQPEPDTFETPLVPDLNPVISGFTGSYTFAGHWSETPDYMANRNVISRLFSGKQTAQEKIDTLHQIGADYIVAPVPEAFPQIEFFDFRSVGTVVVDGNQFRLIKLAKG